MLDYTLFFYNLRKNVAERVARVCRAVEVVFNIYTVRSRFAVHSSALFASAVAASLWQRLPERHLADGVRRVRHDFGCCNRTRARQHRHARTPPQLPTRCPRLQFWSFVCCANGYTCCPSGHDCRDSGSSWSVTTQCVDLAANRLVSRPADLRSPALRRPPCARRGATCLVMGDSVSIGYTPSTSTRRSPTTRASSSTRPTPATAAPRRRRTGCNASTTFSAAPTARPGSATSTCCTSTGACTTSSRTASRRFAGQSGTQSDYLPYLRQIVERLLIARAANPRLTLYRLDVAGNVRCRRRRRGTRKLNAQAAQLMADSGIATVGDLHGAIVGESRRAAAEGMPG